MLTINQLRGQIETTRSIEDITQTLRDVANFKLISTRELKEHNLSYFQEVSKLYRIVKSISLQAESAKNYPNKTLPVKKDSKKPQVVCVLLTANSRFYGGLDSELTKFFIANTQKINAHRVVAGAFGLRYLQEVSHPQPFDSILFKKDSPTSEELEKLAIKVFGYKQILVFHSKFISLLNQVPYISDISASYLEKNPIKTPFHYIAEPEINKILEFFDKQIAFLLFQAIFLEIDYARLAARMIAMNNAEENAQKILKKQEKQLLKVKKELLNMEVIENFASIMTKNGQ